MSLYYIKFTEEKGRGLYALQNLSSGKVLFTAELLVLSAADTIKVNQTDLQFYTFKYNETQDCLVLGDGEIFNHDDNANVGYRLIKHDNRQVMEFYTMQAVAQGAELTINYTADVAVDASQYRTNLVG